MLQPLSGSPGDQQPGRQAEQADPNSGAARALADKIRKTQAVLEGR